MLSNKSVTSEMISFLRFPMAVGVVMLHCFFSVMGWQYNKLAEQGMGSNIVGELLLTGRILCFFIVALYFLISGYLFFVHLQDWDSKVWKHKMYRRIWTLLIPYILWNTFYILFQIGPELAGCLIKGNPWNGVNTWVNDHGGWLGLYWNAKDLGDGQLDLWGHPAHSTVPILLPFYFIRNLMVLNLLSPLFFLLLRSRNKSVSPCAIITLLVLAFFYLTRTSFIIPGFTAEAFFFYGWGAFLSLNRYRLSQVFYSWKWSIAIITFCLFMAELYYGFLSTKEGKILISFFVVFELMTVVNFTSWVLRKSHLNERMSMVKNYVTRWQNASFMIFALHFFLLHYVFRLLDKVGGKLTGFYDVRSMEMANHYPYLVLTNFLLRIVILVSLCMMAYVLMRKFLPRLCKLLCGR